MQNNKNFIDVQALLDDYHDILWADKEVRENICFLIGRNILTGQDISDNELDILTKFLHNKVENYVKNKGN